MTGSEAKICLGVIAGAHGVRGEVRVQSFTARAGDIVSYGPLSDESGTRRFALKAVGTARGQVIARIEGVADRDAAEALRGLRLHVARAALPPLGPEEYYQGDLVGLRCERGDGSPVGTVKAIHNFGAGDVIEITTPDGAELMFSFNRGTVPEIDLAHGRLVIAPPDEIMAAPESDEALAQGEVRT